MKPNPEIYTYIVSEETFADQSVIYKQGGFGGWAYIILDGRVKVIKDTPGGTATLFSLGPGEIIGEVTLLGGSSRPRPTSVVADGPVVLGLLDANRIAKDLNALPPQLRKFISTLAVRLGEAMDKIVTPLDLTG